MDVIPAKKVNIVMDASMFDMFRLCEQRFNYRYNLNLSGQTKANALDRGTLVHLASETYYEALRQREKYEVAVNLAIMKVKEAGVISDIDNDIIRWVIDVMEEYFDHWRFADQTFEIVEVEKPFMYLLYEDDEVRIYMSGKIDLLTNDNKYTNLPYDHKSYDRDSEVGRMSNQFKNYCVATNSNYLIVNRIGFQKTLKPHEKFKRIPLSYDPIYLNEWKSNIVKVMFHYLNCVATNNWPMNETSCDKFNRRCEYYEVCDSSGQEAKNFKLMNNYIKVDPWDVTKVLKKTSEIILDKEKKEDNGNSEAHS